MNINTQAGSPAAPVCGPAGELTECAGKFRLLGRLLAAPPDAVLLEDVRSLGWTGPEDAAALEDLQVEYTRLFSAPGPAAVPAHQSIYTDVLRLRASEPAANSCGAFPGGEFKGYLGGESCSEAGRWYAAAGFRPRDPAPAMADHISTQLDFLAHLYWLEAQARSRPEDARYARELRGEFFSRFTGRWAAAFCAKIATNDVSDFYRSVGRILSIALDAAKA